MSEQIPSNPYAAPGVPVAERRPLTLWPLAHTLLGVLTGLVGLSGLFVAGGWAYGLGEPVRRLGLGAVLTHPQMLKLYAVGLISGLSLTAAVAWFRHRWRGAIVLSVLPFAVALALRLLNWALARSIEVSS
jgi:hypothetical protein